MGEGWWYWRTEVGSTGGWREGGGLYAGHLPHQRDSLFKKVVFVWFELGFGGGVVGDAKEDGGSFLEKMGY